FHVTGVQTCALPIFFVGISCVVFGFFNVRKRAKAFAGDVGSVAMALFLGYLMAKTLILTQNIFYLMFFMVYGIDAAITIFYRLRSEERRVGQERVSR